MDGSDEKSVDLSSDEVREAFLALSAADKQRALEIARSYCTGSEFEAMELLNEAMIRLLEGKRRAPRSHPFMAVLVNAMKSVKSGWYQLKWHTSTEGLEAGDALGAEDPRNGADAAIVSEAAHQAVNMLLEVLNDYPLAQEVVLMRAEEAPAEQIRQELKLTKKQYDSALKRIKRVATKTFPEGWHQCR